jgi:hypothetical protein
MAALPARIAGKKAFNAGSFQKKSLSHIASKGKGARDCYDFRTQKRNSGLKEGLHGWKTKYTDHLGR